MSTIPVRYLEMKSISNVKHVEGQVWSLNVKEDCQQRKETVSYMICPPMVDLPASEKEEEKFYYFTQHNHILMGETNTLLSAAALFLPVLHLRWKKSYL